MLIFTMLTIMTNKILEHSAKHKIPVNFVIFDSFHDKFWNRKVLYLLHKLSAGVTQM